MLLTNRDRRLFQYLFENKTATQAQIGRDIFNGASHQVVNRRLKGLRDLGFIAVRPFDLEKRVGYVYEVTKKGFEEAQRLLYRETSTCTLKSDSPEHDVALVDIIYQLFQLVCVTNIITENSLQCYKDLQEDSEMGAYAQLCCDGVIVMNINGNRSVAALEYDREAKSKKRYIKKIRDYYNNETIKAIFYLCENRYIENSILQADEQVCDQDMAKFFVCQRSEIHSYNSFLTFKNFKGQKIIIS